MFICFLTLILNFSAFSSQNVDLAANNPKQSGSSGILKKSISSPAFFNAFKLISSMSSGFDLSNLFETKRKTGSMFTSRHSAVAIVEKIEAAAEGLGFGVAKEKDFKLRLKGAAEGRKGKLSVTAEVYEVVTEVAVVQFSKSAGDTLEYVKFFEEDVRPALKDIVWTWQGDTLRDSSYNGNGNGNGGEPQNSGSKS